MAAVGRGARPCREPGPRGGVVVVVGGGGGGPYQRQEETERGAGRFLFWSDGDDASPSIVTFFSPLFLSPSGQKDGDGDSHHRGVVSSSNSCPEIQFLLFFPCPRMVLCVRKHKYESCTVSPRHAQTQLNAEGTGRMPRGNVLFGEGQW